MSKKYEVESLNYTDTSRLIDAFKDYIYNGHANKYNLDLLLKLERNKRILYDIPTESEMNTSNG
jgi:hypothetical protein